MTSDYPDGADLRALIDASKARMSAEDVNTFIESVIDEVEDDNVLDLPSTGQGSGLRAIIAEDSVLSAQESAIKARRAQLKKAIKAIGGNAKTLKVDGVKLGTISVTEPVRVNAALVAEVFPVEQYPNLYHEPKEEVRFTADPAFRRLAVDEASTPEVTR